MRQPDTDAVLDLIREVGEQVVRPRWRSLGDADIDQKAPGDYVTVADRESEQRLTAGLLAMFPDAVIVGEEATFERPETVDATWTAAHAFTIDPIDGTRNFVNGREDYAMMIAEIRAGEITRSWIWQPEVGHAFVAEKGAGATLDGQPLPVLGEPPRPPLGATALQKWHGFDAGGRLSPVTRGHWCAGFDYTDVATGRVDYVMFKNIKPWDHAPGALLLQEVGGVARTLRGVDYGASAVPPGLIAARTPEVAELVRSTWKSL